MDSRALLLLFGLLRGYSPLHTGLELSAVAVLAAAASPAWLNRRTRFMAAAAGLVTCSAMLVHLWSGTIEAHFHFFVIIPILILYQDWLPFLVALAYVVVHHGVAGAISPASVYGHAAAQRSPWLWALIHGAFVLAASGAAIVGWRANEQMLSEPLTGLPGRAVFYRRVTLALQRLGRSQRGIAALFLDLDRFKLLNDTLGHKLGDEVLVVVAERLRRVVRRDDLVARLGGDEFAILCEEVGGQPEIEGLAERVQAAIGAPYRIRGANMAVDCSIGIAIEFASPELVDLTANALEKTGLEPSRLGLEITESALMRDVDSPLETLQRLKALGVKLLLDDFGTGYSSLSYLQRFPIDILKVDRSFISALDSHDDDGSAVLAGVAALADALAVDCVAEGVETQRQLEVLAALGYTLAQGYHFARPMSADALADLLAHARPLGDMASRRPLAALPAGVAGRGERGERPSKLDGDARLGCQPASVRVHACR